MIVMKRAEGKKTIAQVRNGKGTWSELVTKPAPTPGPKGLKPAKVKTKRVEVSGKVSAPKDAEPGEKLTYKLHNALLETDPKERESAVFACGKMARDIGLGDPDVATCYVAALKNQKSAIHQENVETDLWSKWGVVFIGGYTAKRTVKREGPFKPYLLTVTIPGDDASPREATYAMYGEAHRAAIRWWVLKSERGEHKNMHITIARQEPGVDEDGKESRVTCILPNSGREDCFDVTYAEAASLSQQQTSRQQGKPAMQASAKPRSHAWKPKVGQTRVTFSGG